MVIVYFSNSICRNLVVGSPSYISSSESTLSNISKVLDFKFDPVVLKSYDIIDYPLSISETLPCAEQDSIVNHRPIEQPQLEECDPSDSTPECSESFTPLASPTTRLVFYIQLNIT
jgi:hypothetical protein